MLEKLTDTIFVQYITQGNSKIFLNNLIIWNAVKENNNFRNDILRFIVFWKIIKFSNIIVF